MFDLIITTFAAAPLHRSDLLVGRIEQIIERDFENGGHLAGVGRQRQFRGQDADHRRHLEAGNGSVPVRHTDNLHRGPRKPDFLLRLPKRRGDRAIVVGIDPAERFQEAGVTLALHPDDPPRPIDGHDMMCAVGNAAVSGGVRRTAMISLFDRDDDKPIRPI